MQVNGIGALTAVYLDNVCAIYRPATWRLFVMARIDTGAVDADAFELVLSFAQLTLYVDYFRQNHE